MQKYFELAHLVFGIFMGLIGIFYLICHLTPNVLRSWVSIPTAFHLHKAHLLNFQTALYFVFHSTSLGQISHYYFLFEQIAWFLLLYLWQPVAAVLLLLLMFFISFKMNEKPFGWYFMALISLIFAVSLGLSFVLDKEMAMFMAEVIVLAGGFIRVLGHSVEPVPPHILSEHFVKLDANSFKWRLIPVSIVGIIAEFSAGFPFRLFPIQMYILALKLGYKPQNSWNQQELIEIAKGIHKEGFAYSPEIAKLL